MPRGGVQGEGSEVVEGDCEGISGTAVGEYGRERNRTTAAVPPPHTTRHSSSLGTQSTRDSHSHTRNSHQLPLAFPPTSRVPSFTMRPSPPQLFARTQQALAPRRGARSFGPSRDPLDMANLVGPSAPAFDFPLTRPTILKLEKQREVLHYLRLEQFQFADLGTSPLPLSLELPNPS